MKSLRTAADLAEPSGFFTGTFLFSVGRSIDGWLDGPLENIPPADGVALAVLPSNSPAPLLNLTAWSWLSGAKLVIKPSSSDRRFAEAWIRFCGEHLPDLSLKMVDSVDDVSCDRAIVYGSDETVALLKEKISTGRFIGCGHRFSVCYLESGAENYADAIASDIVAWDQLGCLSPQTIFVKEGVESFAALLASSLDRHETLHPRRAIEPHQSAAIRVLRAEVAVREGAAVIASSRGTAWSVLRDPRPALEGTPLLRTVWVRGVADRGAFLEALAPHREHLEAVGSDVAIEGLRTVAPGRMQSPPLTFFS